MFIITYFVIIKLNFGGNLIEWKKLYDFNQIYINYEKNNDENFPIVLKEISIVCKFSKDNLS